MICSLLAVALGVTTSVRARYTPRSSDLPLVYLDDLVARGATYQTLAQDATRRIPYFAFEENSLLSDDSLPDVFRRASNATAGLFNHNLKGPGNCKVFPGDANWPSAQDWAVLDDVTGHALLKPTPQAHICYGNGTANASQSSACLDLTKRWPDPFAQ